MHRALRQARYDRPSCDLHASHHSGEEVRYMSPRSVKRFSIGSMTQSKMDQHTLS